MSEAIEPHEISSYTRMTGEIYDLIYSNKDYAGGAAKLARIIEEKSESGGNSILEAACGTGLYLQHLKNNFEVEGFDLSAEQVEAAQRRLPDAGIFQADMLDFDTGRQYDAVLCLFSSIGYLKTKENLDKALAKMGKHTKPGGLVIVEPWLRAEDIIPGYISIEAQSNDQMHVARMGKSSIEGKLTIVDMHHMVGTKDGIEHFLEIHQLALYSDEELTDAFTKAGLDSEIDPEGLSRRLFIGKKPL